jgi:hypothetical protein
MYRYRYSYGWMTTSHEFHHFAVIIDLTLPLPGRSSWLTEVPTKKQMKKKRLVHTGSTFAVQALSSGLHLHSERRCQPYRDALSWTCARMSVDIAIYTLHGEIKAVPVEEGQTATKDEYCSRL